MNIVPPPPAGSELTPQTSERALASWRLGQLLEAIVIAVPNRQSAVLQIGRQQVLAQTTVALHEGQKLSLEVTRGGDLPQLRVIQDASLMAQLAAALRQALPRQKPVTVLLETLAQAARGAPDPAGGGLPPESRQPVARLLAAVPRAEQVITGQGLKQALQNAGLFLEARMLNTRASSALSQAMNNDLKAQVLRLLRSLAPPTGQPAQTTAPPKPLVPAQTTAQTPVQRPAQTPAPALAAKAGMPLQPPPSSVLAPAPPPLPATRAAAPTVTGTAPAPENMPRPAAARLPATGAAAAPVAERATESLRQPAPPASPPPTLLKTAALFELAESALARLQVQQINTLAMSRADDATLPGWSLELPVRQGEKFDLLQLHIQQEATGQQDLQEHEWTIRLAFELGELGPVQAVIRLRGEQVSTTFISERADTQERFDDQLDHLRQRLTELGLDVSRLHSHAGSTAGARPAEWLTPLLDTRA